MEHDGHFEGYRGMHFGVVVEGHFGAGVILGPYDTLMEALERRDALSQIGRVLPLYTDEFLFSENLTPLNKGDRLTEMNVLRQEAWLEVQDAISQ